MAAVAEALRRNGIVAEWLAFFTQVLIAISFEVADDVGRALVSQHGTAQGTANALSIVAFEKSHGFWAEPAWQLFLEQTHRVFTVTMTWPDVVRIMNTVYVGGHVFATLGMALWLFVYRRHVFRIVRNIVILTNLFALLIYETFPVAPPRLTSGLTWDHHPFAFQDTVFGMVSAGGKLIGTQAGYNEYSAMPSVHMAWALIVGACVIIFVRPLVVRLLGLVYPLLMLVAVVVTGNHYLLDAVASVFVVVIASLGAWAFEISRSRIPCARHQPSTVNHAT
ncbi:MAG: hypothetical protein NVS2B16_01090 [Chloroflexota bacterium]